MKRSETLCFGTFVFLFLMTGCGEGEPARTPTPENPRQSAPAQADVAPAYDFQEYMLGELPGPGTLARDPFGDQREDAPIVREKAPVRRRVPAPQLNGIMRSGDRLVALFDRGSAGKDESVRGWKIIEIDERSVTLQRNGRTVRRSM